MHDKHIDSFGMNGMDNTSDYNNNNITLITNTLYVLYKKFQRLIILHLLQNISVCMILRRDDSLHLMRMTPGIKPCLNICT